jgi:4-methylaminobutanoate oxidase (formaldehyde-forming)
MVVTSAICQTRDLSWLRRTLEVRPDARCTVTDVTAGIAMLGVMGPSSRDLLQKLSGADLSNAAHPFGHSKEIEIGYAPVRASRITYVGELGWELNFPAEHCLTSTSVAVRAPRSVSGMRLPRNGRMPRREGIPALEPRSGR